VLAYLDTIEAWTTKWSGFVESPPGVVQPVLEGKPTSPPGIGTGGNGEGN
jgi:hypothetical protein